MAHETTLTLIGNLTRDPELRFTPSGAAVADFTVASTSRTFDRQTNEWKDGDTLFIRCSAWRQLAENVAGSLTKGTRVIVTGALKVREYERQDGSRGTSVEMTVDEVGPSLRNTTATITRTPRDTPTAPAPAPAPASAWDPTPAPAPASASAWDTTPTHAPAAPAPATPQQQPLPEEPPF